LDIAIPAQLAASKVTLIKFPHESEKNPPVPGVRWPSCRAISGMSDVWRPRTCPHAGLNGRMKPPRSDRGPSRSAAA